MLLLCGAVFYDAVAFNGDLSTWEVGEVTTMGHSTYNHNPLSPQNIGSFLGCFFFWVFLFSSPFFVELILFLNIFFFYNMFLFCGAVFWNARAFNGDLSKWKVGKVTHMNHSTYTLPPPPKLGHFFLGCFSLFPSPFCASTDSVFEQCSLLFFFPTIFIIGLLLRSVS